LVKPCDFFEQQPFVVRGGLVISSVKLRHFCASASTLKIGQLAMIWELNHFA